MKKILVFMICIALMLSVCGCGQSAQEGSTSKEQASKPMQKQESKTVSLLCSYTDSFNPYTAKTTANREISSLLHDGLVKVDNNFEAVNVLASSVEIIDKVCTVKLKNASFTDGTAVTADDVIYSYKIAKESPRYSYNFYEVLSANATDSKTVVFNLSQNDPYFMNLLTFPIIKSGTSGLADDDGKEIFPTGCGRYFLSEDGKSFKLNTKYHGKKGNIETINLINSPDEASTAHYVEVGAAAVYYTEGDKIVRMSGKKTDVNLNRFIYIGVNSNYGSLATKEMRYAISSAIDREAVCRTAYYNNAVCATGYFNPSFKPAKSLQTIESKPNSKITVENLSKIGYNSMNSNGYYANSSGNNPVFTLLVNSENSARVAAANIVADQCKTAGIEIKVIQCTYEKYIERLTSGNFHLYLGEVQVSDNMDFAPLVTSVGSISYGIRNNNADVSKTDEENEGQEAVVNYCDAIMRSYHTGTCSIADVATTLLTELPQIPVCYLNGVLFYDSEIKGGVIASHNDIYFSFEDYEF